MGIFTWILFGFIAGSVAGLATGRRGSGCLTKIVVGILGALIGGTLAREAGLRDVSFQSFTLRGLLVAIAGACLLLFVLQALSGRSRR